MSPSTGHNLIWNSTRFVFLSLLLAAFACPRPARAQEPPVANPDFVDALWVATEEGVLKIAPGDSAILAALKDLEEIRALAVDERSGMLWAYGEKTLYAVGFNGEILFDVSLRRPKDRHYYYDTRGRHRRGWDDDDRDDRGDRHDDDDDDNLVFLRVNSEDGSVWLGVGEVIRHFDREGEKIGKITLRDDIEAMDWDPVNSRLWVTGGESVTAYDASGNKALDLDLGWKPEVEDIAVDKETGELWVALQVTPPRQRNYPWWDRRRWREPRDHKRPEKLLRRYAADGTVIFETHVKRLGAIASDGHGGLWIREKKDDDKILRLDAAGTVLAEFEPFRKRPRMSQHVVDIAPDLRDASLWVAGKKALRHMSGEGELLATIESERSRRRGRSRKRSPDLADGIVTLALYLDLIPPTLQFTSPPEGVYSNTGFPMLQLGYGDTGRGIDPSTLTVLANGAALDVSCSFADGLATCTPGTALPEGAVSLTATIQDYAGNVSRPTALSFYVDTIIPVIGFTSPADGSEVSKSNPSIEVTYNDTGSGIDVASARLLINGVDVTGDAIVSSIGVSYIPADSLADGEYEVTATVSDLAGNTQSASLRFTVRVFRAIADCGPTSGQAPLTVTFRSRGQFSNGSIELYRWDRDGDGVFDTTDSVPTDYTFTYKKSGTFTAQLEVTNNFGAKTYDSCLITVTPSPPVAIAEVQPSNGPGPLTVTFTGKAVKEGGSIVLHEWDVDGDGTFDFTTSDFGVPPQPEAITFTFNHATCGSANAFSFYLNEALIRAATGTEPCFCNSNESSVTINDPTLLSAWTTSGVNTLRVEWQASVFVGYVKAVLTYATGPEEVCIFDAANQACANRDLCNGLRLGGDFSVPLQDESNLFSQVTYTYPSAGTFSAVFRVTDSDGLTATAPPAETTIRVGPPGTPVVEATASTRSGNAPLLVFFDGNATDDGSIVSWEWDFDGDGQFDSFSNTSPVASFTYTSPGNFDAVLRATDDSGLSSMDSVAVSVGLEPSFYIPTTAFTPGAGETVSIKTQFATSVPVRIFLKDQNGTVVRTLVNEVRPAGLYSDTWDGKDDAGNLLPQGPYFAILEYEFDGAIHSVDLTYATGGTRYTPSRNVLPRVFSPFDDDLLSITFSIPSSRGPSEVLAYVGSFATGTRFVTMFNRVPFGPGSHTIYWDGLDTDGNLAMPPPGDQFLFGIFAYELPDNAIFIQGAPVLSNVTVDPNYFDPSTPDFITPQNPVATITYDLNKTADIELTVTNLKTGRVLRRISQLNTPGGTGQAIHWDGHADDGRFADKGDYRLALKAVDSSGSQSLVRYLLMRVFY